MEVFLSTVYLIGLNHHAYPTMLKIITVTLIFFICLLIYVGFFKGSRLDNKQYLVPLSIQPVMQDASWAVDSWLPRHEQKRQEVKDRNFDIDLVFLGDSITHHWESRGQEYWQRYYANRKALNLGVGGDRTEHVLWRLQNGAVDGISPKLVLLMIGTNNTGHRQDLATDTALGIQAILAELKARLPETKILLLAIFPRGKSPVDPLRQLNQEINQKIIKFADEEIIFWLDINHLFLDENGILSPEVMNDFLHPETPQYKVWAEALEPHIKEFFDE